MIRKGFLFLLVSVIALGAAAEVSAVTIPLIPLKQLANIQSVGRMYDLGDTGYTTVDPPQQSSPAYIAALDWRTGSFERVMNGGLMCILGRKLFVSLSGAIAGPKYALFDPATHRSTSLPFVFPYRHLTTEFQLPMFYYQNGQTLVARFQGYQTFQLALYDVKANRYSVKTLKLRAKGKLEMDTQLGFTSISTMSPDKTHIVAFTGPKVYVIDVPERRVTAELDPKKLNLDNAMFQTQFISNSLILISSQFSDDSQLFNIQGRFLATIRFTGLGQVTGLLSFSPDLRHVFSGDEPSLYLDSSAFRNYLLQQGWLFHPTTGVMTSSEVNFRHYPNLKAKVIGTLNTGEKLDVLARSGAKQKIEGYDSYWYKVKTAGGTVGWMYGAFIKLADP